MGWLHNLQFGAGEIYGIHIDLSRGVQNEYMSHQLISPFYFPTTVILVDDNIDFLSNLSLQLDSSLAFQLYDLPGKALDVLNSEVNQSTPVERFFSRYHYTPDLPMSHHVIDVNLDKVHREVYNEFRFQQISVVVVDYDMPSIDGLEFCRRIKNPAIKKVLLTGKADEKIAVRAFNDKLIDRFILKQDEHINTVLNETIIELQHDYFRQIERMLDDALAIGKHDYLRDPLFAERFREICDELKIVEFYLCCEPDGMLMLDASGNSSLLLIPNDEELRAQYEIAYEQGAPQELLDLLKSGEVIPYFWQTGGHWVPECRDWRRFLYPATEFKGAKWYSYAIVKDPPLHRTEVVFCYRDFLNDLDQLKWEGA
jgi:CheY-like chemotaxis protein